jgi:hypothetical protein
MSESAVGGYQWMTGYNKKVKNKFNKLPCLPTLGMVDPRRWTLKAVLKAPLTGIVAGISI